MGLANDNGEKIQAMPLGKNFGLVGGTTYNVQPSDRVFQATAAGVVSIKLGDGTTVTGAVGAFIGYGIERGTQTIDCDVAYSIG